jgi:hypothetical protein
LFFFDTNPRGRNIMGRRIRNLLTGAGRLLDFSRSYDSSLRRKYLNTQSSVLDRAALGSDWRKVGNDIGKALADYEEVHVRGQ